MLAKILKIPPRDQCVEALTKMTSCPACQGLPAIRPCSNYCSNVMKGCLAYHSELADSWDKYIGEFLIDINIHPHVSNLELKLCRVSKMLNPIFLSDNLISVGERLIGPFNIEAVVEPIDIKISDAIMNFQESGYEVTQKV